MHVNDLQKLVAQLSDGPQSAKEALEQLKVATEKSHTYLKEGNTAQSQVLLEKSLTYLLFALHYMNLNIEKVVTRELQRNKSEHNGKHDNVILVFSDHAELRVEGELRGTIPLYSEDDYQELQHIAQLFSCRMEHADHIQLDLFTILKSNLAS